MDLNLSLSSCKTLVDALNDHLSLAGVDNISGMSFGSKTKFLLNGREWSHLQTLLSHQISAIQLFLTVMQCRTQVEQESILEHPESRKIICSVRDDSSSLLGLKDEDPCGTRRSVFTESSEFLDISFAFDVEVFKSRAYLSATRSNMKRAVRGPHRRDHNLGIPQRQSTNELSDTPPAANQRNWMLDTQQATSKLLGSSGSNTMFPERRQDQSPDTRSIASSVSPIHGSSGQVVGNPIRHRMLHIRSLLKSRDSFSSLPRASTKHVPSKQKFDDETQILLVGNDKETAVLLTRSMILAYGHNYTKADRTSYRSIIFQILVADIKSLLLAMENQGIPLAEECSEVHAHTLKETADEDLENEASVILNAVATLWRDAGFINNIGNDPNDSKWVYASDDVSLLIHVVDIASYNTTSHRVVTSNHFRQGLALFQKVCASRWLAETPVLVLLSNTAEMAKKLLHSPIRDFFPEYDGESGNVTQAKQFFRDLYLRVERKYDMCVWVDFAEGGATVAIGKSVISIIDKILTEKSVLSYGLR
ncbi:MAG: hypothetical protein Q9213_003986 [Squamulea squamosa]